MFPKIYPAILEFENLKNKWFIVYFFKAIKMVRKIGYFSFIELVYREFKLSCNVVFFAPFEFDITRKTILIVSQDGSKNSNSIFALNLIRFLSNKYNIVVMLFGSGGIIRDFLNLKKSDWHNLNRKTLPGLFTIKRINNLSQKFTFKFSIVNSIESRHVLDALCLNDVPTVSLIHEFSAKAHFEDAFKRDAFRRAMFWSNLVVFSNDVSREEVFSEYPDLLDCHMQTLSCEKDRHSNHYRAEHDGDDEQANISSFLYPKTKDMLFPAFDIGHYASELEQLAVDAEGQMKQEILDSQTILNSGLFLIDFYRSPQQIEQSLETHVRSYVRSWVSGVGRRKPFSGFHPGIYLEQHGVSIPGADPFADYIRAGCPQGVWNYSVISNKSNYEPENLPHNRHVALHIHAYYPDLLPQILESLSFNKIRPDLFVSVSNAQSFEAVKEILKNYCGQVADVQVVPNRGRDIGPFLTQFGSRLLDQYEYIGHLHTKKSAHLTDGKTVEIWRDFLLKNLLGTQHVPMADIILAHLNSDKNLGIVFPDDPHTVGWTLNIDTALPLAQRMNIKKLPKEFLFPIGTMFWARADAFQQLVKLNLNWDDYPAEPISHDGSLLHALERLFGFPSNGLEISTARLEGTVR